MSNNWLNIGNQDFLIQFFYHPNLKTSFPEIVSLIDEIVTKYDKCSVKRINNKTQIAQSKTILDKNFLIYSLNADYTEIIKFLNRLPNSKKNIYLIQIGNDLNSLENIKTITQNKLIINDTLIISQNFSNHGNYRAEIESQFNTMIEQNCKCMILELKKPQLLLTSEDEIADLEAELNKLKKEKELEQKKKKLEQEKKKVQKKIKDLEERKSKTAEIKQKAKNIAKKTKEKWQSEEATAKRQEIKEKTKKGIKETLRKVKEAGSESSQEIKSALQGTTTISQNLLFDTKINDKAIVINKLGEKVKELTNILQSSEFNPSIDSNLNNSDIIKIYCSKRIKAITSPFYQEKKSKDEAWYEKDRPLGMPGDIKGQPSKSNEPKYEDIEINKDIIISMSLELGLQIDSITNQYQIYIRIYADYKEDHIGPVFKKEYKKLIEQISWIMQKW